MIGCFAVIRDGEQQPGALFVELQEAMDWGVEVYGFDTFRIRYIEVAPIERDDKTGANGPM